MLQNLQYCDASLFNFINNAIANPIFDTILPILRNKLTWLPLYVLIIVFCFKKYGLKNGFLLVASMLLCIAFADGIANLFKNYFQRPRPCQNSLVYARLLVHCGTGKSFISAHAANHFALACFWISVFAPLHKWLSPTALIWAALIAFSQIYVGVHYPLDVFVGAIVGIFIGNSIGFAYKKFQFKAL